MSEGDAGKVVLKWVLLMLLCALIGAGMAIVKERNRAVEEAAHNK